MCNTKHAEIMVNVGIKDSRGDNFITFDGATKKLQ